MSLRFEVFVLMCCHGSRGLVVRVGNQVYYIKAHLEALAVLFCATTLDNRTGKADVRITTHLKTCIIPLKAWEMPSLFNLLLLRPTGNLAVLMSRLEIHSCSPFVPQKACKAQGICWITDYMDYGRYMYVGR